MDKRQRTGLKKLSKLVERVIQVSGKRSLKVSKVIKRAANEAIQGGVSDDKATVKADLAQLLHSGRQIRSCHVEDGRVFLQASSHVHSTDDPDGRANATDLSGHLSGAKRPRQEEPTLGKADGLSHGEQNGAQETLPGKEAKATAKSKLDLGDKKGDPVQIAPASTEVGTDQNGSEGDLTKKKKRKTKQQKVTEGAPTGPDQADAEGDGVLSASQQQSTWRESRKRADIKHGRFSKAEEQALRSAAEEYAREHGMSDTDFSWMYKKGKGRQKDAVAKAWPTIASRALPDRSVRAVYNCGLRLLPIFKKGAWTEEENLKLLELVETKGRKWRDISEELDRLPIAIRDHYRELASRSEKQNTGQWSADECALLEEAVKEYLQHKEDVENQQTANLCLDDLAQSPDGVPTPEVDSRQRVILDDVDWVWVAGKVGTRSRKQCMEKWYSHLSPSMVSTGDWGVGDDRKLLKGILKAEAAFYFQVPWETVVPGRTTKQAKRRWALMIKRIPDYSEKSFDAQVGYLVDHFVPGLREKIEKEKSQHV